MKDYHNVNSDYVSNIIKNKLAVGEISGKNILELLKFLKEYDDIDLNDILDVIKRKISVGYISDKNMSEILDFLTINYKEFKTKYENEAKRLEIIRQNFEKDNNYIPQKNSRSSNKDSIYVRFYSVDPKYTDQLSVMVYKGLRSNDTEFVKKMFDTFLMNINGKSKLLPNLLASSTHLCNAIKFGATDIALYMIKKYNEETLNNSYGQGYNAFQTAIQYGNLDVINALISKGINTKVRTEYTGLNSIMLAIFYERPEIFKKVLSLYTAEDLVEKMNIKPTKRFRALNNIDALHYAILFENVDFVDSICYKLKQGLSAQKFDKVINQHEVECNFNAKKKSNTNSRSNDSDSDSDETGVSIHTTRICTAAYLKNVNMIKLLQQYGADINKKDTNGKTALYYAKLPNEFKSKTEVKNTIEYIMSQGMKS
jgi:ankyrin repeat protein